MSLNPPIRSPIVDAQRIFPAGSSHQENPRCLCAMIETRFMECMDAYGLELSRSKCLDYKKDYLECMDPQKQMKRAKIMRRERYRQFLLEGKRPLYGNTPTPDAHFWQ